MWNGTVKRMKEIMRVGHATCEIPLFPPGFHTFPKAPFTHVFSSAREVGPERKVKKWEWGFGKPDMETLWDMEALGFCEKGNGKWGRELGSERWHVGNAT